MLRSRPAVPSSSRGSSDGIAGPGRSLPGSRSSRPPGDGGSPRRFLARQEADRHGVKRRDRPRLGRCQRRRRRDHGRALRGRAGCGVIAGRDAPGDSVHPERAGLGRRDGPGNRVVRRARRFGDLGRSLAGRDDRVLGALDATARVWETARQDGCGFTQPAAVIGIRGLAFTGTSARARSTASLAPGSAAIVRHQGDSDMYGDPRVTSRCAASETSAARRHPRGRVQSCSHPARTVTAGSDAWSRSR